MESKNLIIAFIWIFAIVMSIMLFWTGESYVAGVGGPYIASVFPFFVALLSSAILLQRK